MSTISPIGAGLQRRESNMQPKQQIEEEKKRRVHYVFCPVRTFNLQEQTWKRMSHYVFPRGRICLLETFWYPIKNRTQAKMDNPMSEPDIISFEKSAFNQALEWTNAYGYYGGVKLNAITGVEPQVVSALEQLLMPNTDDAAAYSASSLEKWLSTNAIDGVKLLEDQPELHAVAEKLRQELLACVSKAKDDSLFWINKSEFEIDTARTTGKGKAALDPLDYDLYSFLGITPRSDLIQRVTQSRAQQPDATFSQELIDLLKSNNQVSVLLARVEQLEKMRAEAPAPAPVEAKPKREMKLCNFCAAEIFKEAIYCRHCERDVPTEHELLGHLGALAEQQGLKVEFKQAEPAPAKPGKGAKNG